MWDADRSGAGVFVPRQRTEFLVHQAEALSCFGDIVVDLCCGSGAVGAALAAALGRVELYCVDIDPIAVRCASRNVTSFGTMFLKVICINRCLIHLKVT